MSIYEYDYKGKTRRFYSSNYLEADQKKFGVLIDCNTEEHGHERWVETMHATKEEALKSMAELEGMYKIVPSNSKHFEVVDLTYLPHLNSAANVAARVSRKLGSLSQAMRGERLPAHFFPEKDFIRYVDDMISELQKAKNQLRLHKQPTELTFPSRETLTEVLSNRSDEIIAGRKDENR